MTKRIVCVCFVAFLAILAVAMPSRSDLKKVQPTVNELMAEDISAMKSGKQTSEGAAAKAEELAGLATDEASKFLLLKGAFGLYVEGGKYEAAIAALEALKAQVKNVPDKVLADIVRAKMKKVSKKDGGAILSYYAQLDRRMRSADEKTKLEKAVKDSPSDKDAHRQLALAMAVLDGWPAALAEFALAGGDIAAAAKAEQDGNVAAAADGWWTCAGACGDEDVQEELKAHAAALYAQAIKDGKLDGLKKALAEKRIAECGGAASPKGASSAAPQPVRTAVSDVATPKKVAVPQKKYDWTIPKNLKKPKVVEMDLGGGVAMRFLAQAPGECTLAPWLMPSHQVKITRPFWITQLPVSFDQYELYEAVTYERLIDAAEKFKGDPDVWVSGCNEMHKARAYAEWFQSTYGHLLPKGMVFRLMTQGEWALCDSRRCVRNDLALSLKVAHGKGLAMEFANVEDLSGKGCVVVEDFLACCQTRKVVRENALFAGNHALCLDCISCPSLAGRFPFDRGVISATHKLCSYQQVEVDPFRMCAEDAPEKWWWCGGKIKIWFPRRPMVMHLIYLVAGYDYVGDWKKKHGK